MKSNSAAAIAAAYDRGASIDALDRAIVTLASRINAATYDLLVLIRRFDERAGWLAWGFQSCAEWLHYRCDISLSAAREKVRVAHAL
ncbi:MAG: HNH endonuclease, partial [Gammaproteobacteria bacterium]|nr:HNH endonuclease [Gammaproteobacteria bacterium]